MSKRKHKYHVTLSKVIRDDDGRIEHEYVVYEQDTFALSPKKAVSNARYNSGYPSHGNVSYMGASSFATIEAKCELVEL